MIQSSSVSISFLVKIYLRRAQARYSIKKLEDAKDDIKSLLLLDERNEQGRRLQAKIKTEINLDIALEKKSLADSHFKAKEFTEALIHYDESSKLLEGPENQYDLIKVL